MLCPSLHFIVGIIQQGSKKKLVVVVRVHIVMIALLIAIFDTVSDGWTRRSFDHSILSVTGSSPTVRSCA